MASTFCHYRAVVTYHAVDNRSTALTRTAWGRYRAFRRHVKPPNNSKAELIDGDG